MIDRILFRLALWIMLRRYGVVTIVASRDFGNKVVSSRWTSWNSTMAARIAHVDAIGTTFENLKASTANAVYVASVECGL